MHGSPSPTHRSAALRARLSFAREPLLLAGARLSAAGAPLRVARTRVSFPRARLHDARTCLSFSRARLHVDRTRLSLGPASSPLARPRPRGCYAPAAVTVRVLYFAGLRDAVGTGEEALDLPPTVRTIATLADHLAARHPAFAARRAHVRIARNEAFARDDEPVADGDVIALIPPVAGG